MRISDWSSDVCSSDLTKALCGGIVETLGLAPSAMRNHRFGLRAGARRADIEPQALMRDSVAAARLDRPVPQQVHRERAFGRIVEQAFRHQLHPGEDEGRNPRSEEHTSDLQSLMIYPY